MTDRELLELAAKAAGMITTCSDTGCYYDEPDRMWNPITDDGDALRLAVKLEMFNNHHEHPSMQGIAEALWGPDPYAATRRAIVRAAAEIGKEMK